MTPPFSISPLPTIHFGAGQIRKLPALIGNYGKTALLITGARSFTSSNGWSRLAEELEQAGIDCYLERVTSEPSPASVNQISEQYAQMPVDVVVAIGGGSVLDGGKAVSAMLPLWEEAGGKNNAVDVTDYLEGVGAKTPQGRKKPFVAVPTTAGTGSEVTSNAVLSQVGTGGFKKSLRHSHFIPDIALVDPELTHNCPLSVSASCSLDAFSQLVESYLSVNSSPYTDDIAMGALNKLKKSLLNVCRGQATLEDRVNMSYAAMISGITLTNAGLGVVHGFASVIGGRFGIPHGVVCGTLMAAANTVTLRNLKRCADNTVSLEKYSRLGELFADETGRSREYYRDCFIALLGKITDELQMPPLSRYGVTDEDLRLIAQQSGSKNNPVELNQQDKQHLLQMRL